MKTTKIGLLCLALLATATTGMAAVQPVGTGGTIKVITSGIPHAALFGISFDNGTGVAVGVGGMILNSEDGGASWTPVEQKETALALLAVDRRGAHTIAVGQTGLVMIEESPGQWKKVDSGATGRLLSVSVNSSGMAVAGGEFGTLLTSQDGGQTWASTPPDWASYADANSFGTGEPHVYSVHVNEAGDITIAGEFGMILRRKSGSPLWTVLRPITAGKPTLFAMSLSDTPVGNSYAVGQSGEVLISADGGEHWFRNAVKTDANFLGVVSAPGGKVVITGMRVMMKSSNGGIDWTAIEDGDTTTEWYQAVRLEQGSGRIMAVGHSGRIIQIEG